MNVVLLDPNNHFDDSLPSILDLNDDCLLKIISNLTDIYQLLAVNRTCRRLQQLSEYHFRLQYNCKPFLLHLEKKAEEILTHFGKYINKLIVPNWWDLWNLIEPIGSHLEELKVKETGCTRFEIPTSPKLLQILNVYQLLTMVFQWKICLDAWIHVVR